MQIVGKLQDSRLVSLGDARQIWSPFEVITGGEGGSPNLVLTFEVREGLPQCRRAELRSMDDGREVLSSDLRGVKLEDLLETSVQYMALVATRGDPGPSGAYMVGLRGSQQQSDEERRRTLAETRRVRREARRKVTPELLAEVARVYRENVDGNPTVAVADFTGRAHRTAALYVKQAREAGLLGAASPGRKGEQ